MKTGHTWYFGPGSCPERGGLWELDAHHADAHANADCHAGPHDATLSARERYHAAIAYSRPVGNRDPDDDSQTSAVLSLPRVTVY